MKKWLIGSGIVVALVAILLLVGLAIGAFAQDSAPSGTVAITAEEAKAAVLSAYPGATVVEVELERENGILVYEVELDNGLEVLVDANSDAVLGLEQEDADGAFDDVDDAEDADDTEND